MAVITPSAGARTRDVAGTRATRLTRVPRLLLITSACDGEDVGEAWVGYQWVSRLAARHDVTLLTMHRRDRKPPSEQLPSVRVIEWRDPKVVTLHERLN